jgi:uncharacterized protein
MRHPGAGAYRREDVPKPLRSLVPCECLNCITEVSLDDLWNEGRKLVLLDVDNTLLPWKSETIEPETRRWLEHGKALGLKFVAVSNTRRPERLERICSDLGIGVVRGKFKPSPNMYVLALEEGGFRAEEAVMIGDQLLTDVLGANRAGIDAIWVQRLTPREFVGTRIISRNVERVVGLLLRRWFQGDAESQRPGFFQKSVVRQLVKFAIVGGSATVVDLGLHYWLMRKAQWNGGLLADQVGQSVIDGVRQWLPQSQLSLSDAAWLPLKIVPVLLAIIVSYALNFAWTFKSKDASPSLKQAAKFYMVALVGMVISIAASTIVKQLLHGPFQLDFALASIAGIVAGFAWNFNAQRIWTFRAHLK